MVNVSKNVLKFNEDLQKNYDEDSDKGLILEVDVEYPVEFFFNKHKDLPFLPKKIKITLNGPKIFVCDVYNKNNYVFT